MAQIDTLTNVGAVVSTDLALILRGGANVLGTFGSLVGQNATSVTITGGTVNNTVIGGVTPAAGSFTTVTADGLTVDGGGSLTFSELTSKITGPLNQDFIIQQRGNADTEALRIQNVDNNNLAKFDKNGDISFYEDTGTTAKMVWSASTESLEIGSGASGTLQGLIVNTANSVYASTVNAGATLQLSDTSAGAGQGNFGPSIWFGGTNQPRALVGIRAKQTGTDSEHMGLSFFTHPGASAGDLAVEQMVLNSAGNVGIGSLPDAWKSTWTALDIGDSGSLYAQDNNTTGLANNLYFNGSTWVHKNTGATALYQQSEGVHNFYSNASQAAGSTFSPASKMTLDASGNLLVGKTTTTFGTAGIALRGTVADFTRDGGPPINVNRLTSDGSLINFHKAGAPVGSIGTEGGDLTIGNGDAGIQFVNGTEHFRPQNMTTNSATDGLMNIGSAAYRFKDLYLSGNANVASVVASGSVIASLFTSGSFNYTSGTTAIITIPQDSIYLFMSQPENYGASDNRHGAVYIIRRWASSVGSTELAASAAGRGVFTIATGGTVTYESTGAGVPSTVIYWMRIG